MEARQTLVLGMALALAATVSMSCASTTVPARSGGAGRMEALVGMEAVANVLARQAGKSVLVYHSPRCDFCRSVLESFAATLPELDARAVVYTVDIDSNPTVRDTLGIGPVPVVVFLQDGQEVKRWRVYRCSFLARRGLRSFFTP